MKLSLTAFDAAMRKLLPDNLSVSPSDESIDAFCAEQGIDPTKFRAMAKESEAMFAAMRSDAEPKAEAKK